MTVESENLEFICSKLPCKSVTVYTDRAEVKRLVNATLQAGPNDVIIKGLPKTIDTSSVRVDGRGPATICEVQYFEKHVKKEEEAQEKQKELTKQLEELCDKRAQLKDRRKVLDRKKGVIDGVADQISKGAKNSDENKESKPVFSLTDESLNSLDRFVGFYAEKLTDLDDERRALDKEIKGINEEIHVVQRNISDLEHGQDSDTFLSRQVSVILDASESAEIELDVSYIVHSASWTPSYDIRVYTGENKAMKVHYYGQVQQNTGEDWTETELSLSTAMPSIGGSVPQLKTLKASLYKPPPMKMKCTGETARESMKISGKMMRSAQRSYLSSEGTPTSSSAEQTTSRSAMETLQMKVEKLHADPFLLSEKPEISREMAPMKKQKKKRRAFSAYALRSAAPATSGVAIDDSEEDDLELAMMDEMPEMDVAVVSEVQESVTCTNFHIARATTIPSDNSSHKVNVAVVDLSPSFEHESVPSKSQFAFLKAKVVNNSKYPFLAGPVSVFLDNNFVAKSSIKAVSSQEEFSCSLGADPAVRVEYKPVRVFHEQSGMWTKSSVEIHQQRINIKNTHTDPVTLKILEQVPLSTDEKVKVTVIKPEISKEHKEKEYKLNRDNNLEWDLKMKPGQDMDIEVKWSVEYPKNETMELKEEH